MTSYKKLFGVLMLKPFAGCVVGKETNNSYILRIYLYLFKGTIYYIV